MAAAKKKWSTVKKKEKLNNAVIFDKATWEKVKKEVPQYKMITPAIVSDRMKITASLAKHAIDALEAEGKIRPVIKHNALKVYTHA